MVKQLLRLQEIKLFLFHFLIIKSHLLGNSFRVSDTGSLDHSESTEGKRGKKGKREKQKTDKPSS